MADKHIVLWRERGTKLIAKTINVPVLAKATTTAQQATPATPAAIEIAQITISEAKKLAKDPAVAAVAPVMPMRLIRPLDVNAQADPVAGGSTWGIRAVRADTSPFTGAGIVVAILDTGIDANHPAFQGVELVRKNFIGGAEEDEDGHGTHCAGTVFGRDVDGIRIGVARGVTKAVIGKVLGADGGGSDVVVSAIQWAVQNGAHVISMSLGLDYPGFVESLTQQKYPPALATALALEGYRANIKLFENLAAFLSANSFFTSHPTLLVAAAGNESKRDLDPAYEIGVSPPAVATGIVSVAALQNGAAGLGVAAFSNTGARVSGPGVGVISAHRGGGLVAKNGTSMATPHVAGVAALWAEKLAAEGQLNANRLMDAVIASATQTGIAAPFDPSDVGLGIVQAPQS